MVVQPIASRYTDRAIPAPDRKGSVEKKSGREPQGAWRQVELIGGEPPVVK
jgi:hypothetical protein